MADSEARALDRAARAGDPEAEVRSLRERLRRGAVSREQVALLAYVGDEAAALVGGGGLLSYDALGRAASDDHAAWAHGLAPLLVAALDREALVRVLDCADREGNAWPLGENTIIASLESAGKGIADAISTWLVVDAERLGPRLRPVVLAAVWREVWGG